MTKKCRYCLDPIHNDNGVWVDKTGGDVCGNYGTYTNEPHVLAPEEVECQTCGNQMPFNSDSDNFCDRCIADAENEYRRSVSDYWRA